MFSATQLAELRKASLSRLICDNADNIDTVPENALTLTDFSNFVRCSQLPSVNLDFWTERDGVYVCVHVTVYVIVIN